ncbi:MAG: hypothetical protein K9L28_02510 [Synergistales bacterium]|nr:hypothetical protein [Synergistales bacterium]
MTRKRQKEILESSLVSIFSITGQPTMRSIESRIRRMRKMPSTKDFSSSKSFRETGRILKRIMDDTVINQSEHPIKSGQKARIK